MAQGQWRHLAPFSLSCPRMHASPYPGSSSIYRKRAMMMILPGMQSCMSHHGCVWRGAHVTKHKDCAVTCEPAHPHPQPKSKMCSTLFCVKSAPDHSVGPLCDGLCQCLPSCMHGETRAGSIGPCHRSMKGADHGVLAAFAACEYARPHGQR